MNSEQEEPYPIKLLKDGAIQKLEQWLESLGVEKEKNSLSKNFLSYIIFLFKPIDLDALNFHY
jgi:hypothetical protein